MGQEPSNEDNDFISAYSPTAAIKLIDASTAQNTDGNTLNLVYWSFRDFYNENFPVMLQMQIIQEFEILSPITEVELYYGIEIKADQTAGDQVNDVVLCMLDIVQSEIDGHTQMTLEATSVRDTYVATDTSVYQENINLTHDDTVNDWSFIPQVSRTDAFYQT